MTAAMSVIQSRMCCLQMMLETDNVPFPSLHTALGDNPDFFSNLINKPEVMTDKHQATIPLCSTCSCS